MPGEKIYTYKMGVHNKSDNFKGPFGILAVFVQSKFQKRLIFKILHVLTLESNCF